MATGFNNNGQLNVSSWTNIKAVAASANHTVGLKEDGTVVATGNNDYGQLNVSSWTNIKAIAAGQGHTVGLKEDGTVVAVGDNYYGQCNLSSWTTVTAVAAGPDFTIGLKENGTVVGVGDCNNGQCSVYSWTNIKAIAAGANFTVGLKADGTVVATGSNGSGQLNVSSWTNIKAVAAGASHTVGLKADGTVVAAGSNNYGQLNVSTWTNITAIAAVGYHTIGLKEGGTVVAVGYNYCGQLNAFDWSNIKQPVCASPEISASLAAIAFGEVQLGSAATYTFSILNGGSAALLISSVSVTGPDSTHFSQTNDCTSVAYNTSCTVTVTFTPASQGAKSATLEVASDDPDTPTLTISLTGTGVDVTSPTTSIAIGGVSGNNGWYKSDMQITLTATDNTGGSGVKEIHYSIDGTETIVSGSTASFTVSPEGIHSVSYFAKDNVGNDEALHVPTVKIDKTPPVLTVIVNPSSDVVTALVTFECNDAVSGVFTCPSLIGWPGQGITGNAVDLAGNTLCFSMGIGGTCQ